MIVRQTAYVIITLFIFIVRLTLMPDQIFVKTNCSEALAREGPRSKHIVNSSLKILVSHKYLFMIDIYCAFRKQNN